VFRSCAWRFLLAEVRVRATETASPTSRVRWRRSNRVHRAYVVERTIRPRTANSQTAWQFARACFDRADFATNDTQRAAFAAKRHRSQPAGLLLAPDSAAAYFYWA